MLAATISNEKIEHYKKSLEEPFWELHEAAYRLSGVTEFAMQISLDSEDEKKLQRKKYGVGPSCLLDTPSKGTNIIAERYALILGHLIEAMQNRRLVCHRLPLYFKHEEGFTSIYEYNSIQANNTPCLKDHTYFLLPHEVIYITVSLGIVLPIELQIAGSIYQIVQPTPQPLSKRQINDVKRDAVAQAYWWSFPNENISTICRKINKLKTETDFDFLHSSNYEGKKDTNMRPRTSVQKMQSEIPGEIKWIPEVIQKHEDAVHIDFQRLKLVFNVMMKMMLLKKHFLQIEEFLAHPLISLYSSAGNQTQKLVSLCAKDALNDLGFC